MYRLSEVFKRMNGTGTIFEIKQRKAFSKLKKNVKS